MPSDLPPIVRFTIEVDWAGDGLYQHPGSDITGDVVGDLEFGRGRGSYGSQIYGRSSAGILMCTLRNDSRQYDSLSVQTSIGNLLTSQRRIRVKLSYPDAAERIEWSGYLDSVAPKERRGGMDIVKLQALGVMALLQEARPLVAVGAKETIGSILGRIVEAIVPGLDNSLLTSTRVLARWVRNPLHTGLESMRELEETEVGFLYEHREGNRLVLEGRNDRAIAGRTPNLTLADIGGEDAIADRLEPILRAQDIANVVRIPVKTYAVETTGVLWSNTHGILVPPLSSIRIIAEYPTPSAPTNHVGVEGWEPLTPGTDYMAQAGLTVSQTSEGNQLVIELANGSGIWNHASQPPGARTGPTPGGPGHSREPVH